MTEEFPSYNTLVTEEKLGRLQVVDHVYRVLRHAPGIVDKGGVVVALVTVPVMHSKSVLGTFTLNAEELHNEELDKLAIFKIEDALDWMQVAIEAQTATVKE